MAIYDDARFELGCDDSSTWEPAISHGLGKGLLREWLDFPTDKTTVSWSSLPISPVAPTASKPPRP